MNANDQKLSFKEKFSYGFGDLASVLYWQTFMMYLTYFYTDIFLLPASVAAFMFLITRIWDGVNDPVMGIVADRTNTKWGKFRPYLLWLCVPFAVSGVLVFTVPDFGTTGKIVWAYATFILIMMLYTAINIPYTALLGVISADSNERTSVSSFKFVFAFVAGIIVSATLLPMTKGLGDGNDAQGWQLSFVIYGIAAVIFFLIAFRGTKERVLPPKSQKSSIKKDLYELVTNKPWIILLATTITFILFVAVRSSVTAHYFKYFIGSQQLLLLDLMLYVKNTVVYFFQAIFGSRDFSLPIWERQMYSFEALVSAFNTVGQIASLIGALLISRVARLLGKKKAFTIIFVIAIVSTSAFYFCTSEQMGLIFFLQIIGSITGGPLSVLLWAMYADTADYAEWKNGRRATGLVFSASTMSQKIGWAIGAYVALMLMSQVGFQANEIQTQESLDGLVLLFSLIPGVLGIVSIIIVIFYPLNDKRVAEIEGELKERRIENGDEADQPA